jgi:TRAP transporter TAXI family solute receptor
MKQMHKRWMVAAVAALAVVGAQAQSRVTYKSAKAGSSYYQMGVEIAEAMKAGSQGAISVTVEESQGSVQNVMEVRARGGDYVFTTPPALVAAAQGAKGPFKDKGDPKFADIRALFPIPALTMHLVARADSGVRAWSDLGGKSLLLGKGSFGAREGEKYLGLFGVKDQVKLVDVELSNAVAALKNGQVDAFVTAGSWPAPNVVEAAASTPVVVVGMSAEQVAQTKRDGLTIPAGTYSGQSADVQTTTLPVVAYTTTAMSDDVAYALTQTFWQQKAAMSAQAPWWRGVDQSLMGNIRGKIHPGAVRYYKEQGFALRADQM